MSFDDVAASAYGRFMGRYADPLAPLFCDHAGIRLDSRVLDVGCGPGALTAVLVGRLGSERVAAIDPSPSFVAAAAARFPDVEVLRGAAEALPHADDSFDAAMAQLVVHFMTDPVQGLREMARVTVPGGTVAACVWDHAGGRGPLSPFWQAVADVVPGTTGEAGGNGARAGHLRELAQAAGLVDVAEGELTVTSDYADFAEWWEPYLAGVGPAGEYAVGLDEDTREAVRVRAGELLGPGPFTITATAWTMRARA